MRIITNTIIASLLWTTTATTTTTSVTRVTVLEFGKGGVVRPTTSTGSRPANHDSVESVRSFWSSLHDGGHHEGTHPFVGLVPDLFRRADGGVILGWNNDDDSASLPSVVARHRVGDLDVANVEPKRVVPKDTRVVRDEKEFDAELKSAWDVVKDDDSHQWNKLYLDGPLSVEALASFLERLEEYTRTHDDDKTVVVHLVYKAKSDTVVPEVSRRLESTNGIYTEGTLWEGFSYMKDGEVVHSPTKTIYEIQTFNIYLWTAIGLFLVVYTGVSFFANMQLFPDTLLFGEAGKPID